MHLVYTVGITRGPNKPPSNKSPLQKKKIESYLACQTRSFFKEADKFIADYSGYLESQGISFDYAIDAYLKVCKGMVKSQVYFMKTDKYPMENQCKTIHLGGWAQKPSKQCNLGPFGILQKLGYTMHMYTIQPFAFSYL